MQTAENHAIENAKGWAQSIIEMVNALEDAGDDREAAEQAIQESVLSVEMRGDWYSFSSDAGNPPVEYRILLTTGGPALQLVGDLDGDEPTTARLQYQDWGTPWTDFRGEASQDTLLAFARCFYFGA